jgi:hypothetical protein
MARQCQHPDAQWLAGLFPAGSDQVTWEDFAEAMKECDNDPRALFFRFYLEGAEWKLGLWSCCSAQHRWATHLRRRCSHPSFTT